MDESKHKHICKFCFKTFPCGRSLGGHMRSHLITISSSEKKLPPMDDNAYSYALRQNPKKTPKFSNKTDHDGHKHCNQCGKSFQSWKALFGHMKCHSPLAKSSISVDHHTLLDDESDNEASIPLCKRKRSERIKRYTTTTISSSLTSVSEIDQQEQEEVALSLILLSMDVASINSAVGSSTTTKKMAVECEVNSPRTLTNKIGLKSSHFGSETTTKKKSKLGNRPYDEEDKSKFRCIICNKAFPSYQALGGHRASHKKYKGCCAPNTLDNEDVLQEKIEMGLERRGSRDHECPICFKLFSSGQALGGHKRSHLANHIDTTEKSIPQIRHFLDLNMPAPLEEQSDDCKPWWIASSHDHHLGFLSTS